MLLIFLGKTGSELRKISSQSKIIKKEKSKLFEELDLSNHAKMNALDKIDNYKSALEIAKRSTVSLSKNLAMREKSITDLEFRIQAQNEKYQSLTLKWEKNRSDLLGTNKNLKLKLKNLEDFLTEESKKVDNLKTQIAIIVKSNRATIKENNRLYALHQINKQKINDLEKGLFAHEVMCEERWKTCFQRLEDVETSLNRIETRMVRIGGTVIMFLAGVIVTLLTQLG